MNLFYIPKIENNNTAFLNQEESKHCVRVLRMQEGDAMDFTDGKGRFFHGKIAVASPKKCIIEIENITVEEKNKPDLHIAIAPTKNINRTEWFLEKATEIGISVITPLYSFHSERKVIKPDRLEKVLISAMKQSLKATLPFIADGMTMKQFLSSITEKNRYFAYCGDMEKQLLQQVYPRGENAVIMIGPEGGFSPEEAQMAIEHGFKPVSLGSARLRTETAGVVACHTFNLLNESGIYTLKV